MIRSIDQWWSRFVHDDVYLRARAVEDYTDKLTPTEFEFIASSVAIRRETYSTGRFCAKTALQDIGIDRHDYVEGLLRQEDGSVAWPAAAVGSISHTNDWAVAVVARSGKDYLSLGVDIEKIDRVQADVLCHIATDAERANLECKYDERWGKVALFSVKESVYKCLRPLYGQFFGFKDVQVCNLNAPIGKCEPSDQYEPGLELYRPTVKLLLPSLAERCDEQRIRVRLAVLPSHVLSLVSYYSAPRSK